MTHQQINALAQALKVQWPAPHWDKNKQTQWDLDCRAIADVCHTFNKGFNRNRFFDDCGGLFYLFDGA
jgi:hypothetical protein